MSERKIKKMKVMQQDGTLSEAIPIGANAENVDMANGENLENTIKSLSKKYIEYYNNVAEMKNDTELKAGMACITHGYHNTNDGGGAKYKIVDDATLVDDGGAYHKLNNGLYAKLVIDEPNKINVLQFGVKRNIDEDQSVIVNSLLAMNSKNILYFPSGYYYFTNNLNNLKRHDIIGACNTYTDWDSNLDNTRFKFVNIPNDTILIKISGGRVTIKDIYIICDAYDLTYDKSLISRGTEPVDIFTEKINKTGITGISLENFGCNLEKVSVKGCNLGYDIKGYNVINNCGALCCQTGFKCDNDNVVTALNIQRCNVGFEVGGNLNNFINIRMDSIKTYGFKLNYNTSSNNFTNCIADFCQYAVFFLNGSSNNHIHGVIGRSGTYYAGFSPDTSIDAKKACKIVLQGSSDNNIDISSLHGNLLDQPSDIVTGSTYCVVAYGNSQNNDIKLVGSIPNAPTGNNLLTIEQLAKLYYAYLPTSGSTSYSGSLRYRGIEYIIANTGKLTENNVYIAKGIRYYNEYLQKNSKTNIVEVNGRLSNISEIRMGDATNGWICFIREGTKLKLQYLNPSYIYSDIELIGLSEPTLNNGAANKSYVDNK